MIKILEIIVKQDMYSANFSFCNDLSPNRQVTFNFSRQKLSTALIFKESDISNIQERPALYLQDFVVFFFNIAFYSTNIITKIIRLKEYFIIKYMEVINYLNYDEDLSQPLI